MAGSNSNEWMDDKSVPKMARQTMAGERGGRSRGLAAVVSASGWVRTAAGAGVAVVAAADVRGVRVRIISRTRRGGRCRLFRGEGAERKRVEEGRGEEREREG